MSSAPRLTPAKRQLLANLYQQELAYVLSTLRRLGVPSKDVEDVAQDVFVLVYARLHEMSSSRSFRPWLFAACRMVAANFRRKKTRTDVSLETEHVEERVDPGPTPASAAEQNQYKHQLWQALQTLSEEQQTAFILFELDGVPMNEIAALQQVPLHTAYSRLKAARAKLTQLLNPTGSETP